MKLHCASIDFARIKADAIFRRVLAAPLGLLA
jgi:hypothetical protein